MLAQQVFIIFFAMRVEQAFEHQYVEILADIGEHLREHGRAVVIEVPDLTRFTVKTPQVAIAQIVAENNQLVDQRPLRGGVGDIFQNVSNARIGIVQRFYAGVFCGRYAAQGFGQIQGTNLLMINTK